MSNVKLYVVLYILLCISGCSQSQNTIRQQGQVTFTKDFIEVRDSSNVPYFKHALKVWFKDSIAIYEGKIILENVSGTPTTLAKFDYPTYKYTIHNLKTNVCQEYANFSDTAKPYCTYQLKPHESVNWNFHAIIPMSDGEIRTKMSDTTIGEKQFQRINYSKQIQSSSYNRIFYFDCAAPRTILHINPFVDAENKNCVATRYEIRTPNYPTNVFEIRFERDKLTVEESKIFAEWSKNLRSVKGPYLSREEGWKKGVPAPLPPGF